MYKLKNNESEGRWIRYQGSFLFYLFIPLISHYKEIEERRERQVSYSSKHGHNNNTKICIVESEPERHCVRSKFFFFFHSFFPPCALLQEPEEERERERKVGYIGKQEHKDHAESCIADFKLDRCYLFREIFFLHFFFLLIPITC